MNKRILITVFSYISIIIALIIASLFSLQTANHLIQTKAIEQRYGQSHILDLKKQLLSNQQAINSANENQKIKLGSEFYALKSSHSDNQNGYYNITSDLSVFNQQNDLIGHFTVLNHFFIQDGQVSIVDITDMNSEFRPWFIQSGGYGPASRASYSLTASLTFEAWLSGFSEKNFMVTANTSLSPDSQVSIVWEISDDGTFY